VQVTDEDRASAAASGSARQAAGDVPEQMQVRLDKINRLRAAGIDPYPPGFPRTATIAQPDACRGSR